MPIQDAIPTFWWFSEAQIGGMGRPGFNRCPWAALSLEEAGIFSWLGQHSEDDPALDELWAYLAQFAPKVAPFYGLPKEVIQERFARLRAPAVFLDVVKHMNDKTGILAPSYTWEDGATPHFHFHFAKEQIQQEIAALNAHGITTLVNLMHVPSEPAIADSALEVVHIPIEDLTPPTFAQVEHFARLLLQSYQSGTGLVVHCFAGVGRTTTMLLASHLMMGWDLSTMLATVQKNNPTYQCKGAQWEFLHGIPVSAELSVLFPEVDRLASQGGFR